MDTHARGGILMGANPAAPFDWSAPRFLQVEMDARADRVALSAGGQSVTLHGPLFRLDADGGLDPRWSAQAGEFLVLSLDLEARRETLLREVSWFPGEWDPGCERVVSRTEHQDNVLFLRKGGISFFVSLDFPYSRIGPDGISYPPHDVISPGATYRCHTLSVGACRLSGIRVGDLDRAEIEAGSAYVERRYPQRFERPLFLYCCITNRMTDPREGRVFYSMHDNPTLGLSPDLVEEDIRICGEVGIEYYQVFEGVFDWPDEEKTGAALRRLVKLGESLGVRMGDYVAPGFLHCAHYNYEHRRLERPEWRRLSDKGEQQQFCLGCPDYLDFLRGRLVEHGRAYGEEMICMDFLGLRPCYATNHGHSPGDLYRQVRGLVSLLQALNDLSPNYLVWSNSGNWLQFMPKLTWFNHNVYLTDPHVRGYMPTLNILKLVGDGRREQMVSVHDRYFVPWRAYTNCEYYLFPRSRVNDVRVFEYSFLQGLAVTPNLCAAELRTFLNRIPSGRRDACVGFMRKWLRFIRENFDVWKRTAIVGDPPGPGGVEIYSHAAGDHGFVCLINQNPFPRLARFRLDGSLGLEGGEHFRVREVYPGECPISEQPLPGAEFGAEITYPLPAHSVRYLEVRPCTPGSGVTVCGLPAQVEKTTGGYRLTVRAPQGERVPLGIALPKGEAIASVSARQTPTVPMYTFPASARVVEQRGNVARLDVTFPRSRAPRELTHWRCSPGDVELELPLLGDCPFLGGLVSGAFSEELEVQMEIGTRPTDEEGILPAPAPEPPGPSGTLPAGDRHTFETEFELPFIEPRSFGFLSGYEDDAVVELAFSDPNAVQSIGARLNGEPVPVQRYRYPKGRDRWSYYVELTGNTDPGTVRLAMDVEWRR
ncbi:MAG: hypothetical protein HY321_17450 [Armatimonadetes bacterium]|nr:hypothetical protein [Armatimonadota bacterium]